MVTPGNLFDTKREISLLASRSFFYLQTAKTYRVLCQLLRLIYRYDPPRFRLSGIRRNLKSPHGKKLLVGFLLKRFRLLSVIGQWKCSCAIVAVTLVPESRTVDI